LTSYIPVSFSRRTLLHGVRIVEECPDIPVAIVQYTFTQAVAWYIFTQKYRNINTTTNKARHEDFL
jgi:hypothetical protein